jgi:hypothetical protein
MIRRLATAAIVGCLLGTPVAAQHVVSHGDGTISVRALDVPLGVLLRELSQQIEAATFRVDPAADRQLVSIDLDALPAAAAVVEVLKRVDVDFVFSGGRAGEPVRLLAAMFEFTEPAATTSLKGASGAASAEHVEDEQVEHLSDAAVNDALADTQRTLAAMTSALTTPVTRPAPGGVVALPFPDEAGEPAVQTVAPGADRAIPFPAVAGPPQAAPARAAPLPQESSFTALEQALAPPRSR